MGETERGVGVKIETTPTIRLDVAITAEQEEMFECAASMDGLTLDLLVDSVLEVHAENVIRGPQEPPMPLSPWAHGQLWEATENPAAPSEGLRARNRRYLQRLDEKPVSASPS
jgi:uncharacterized protein (DUF1778 family)